MKNVNHLQKLKASIGFKKYNIRLIGKINIVAQIKIDEVTFSFFLLLIFKVNNPPIT